MLVRQVADPKLAQFAYLIGCPRTGEALVIDPERDVDRYFDLAARHGLRIVAAADTHIHADYLSGLREMAARGVRVYASKEGGPEWQYEWLLHGDYPYRLLGHGDEFSVGRIEVRAVHTPGHTPEHLSYLVRDVGGGAADFIALASGDFVFVGDVGRPDLLERAAGMTGVMEPSARAQFASIQREFRPLPEFLQVWPGHGAGSACGKSLGDVPTSTVGYELRTNRSINAAVDERTFVDFILAGQPEPPLYFARMKRDNRRGPQLLPGLPSPLRLDPADLADLENRTDVAVLDTRARSAFFEGHLAGSLLAELDYQFCSIAGSYVAEGTPIYLLVDKGRLDEAVRALIRVGLDRIVGYFTPETLAEFGRSRGSLRRLTTIDFAELEAQRTGGGVLVLDVRGAVEFDAGHVPDALHVPHTRVGVSADKLPFDRPVLVYCNSGARSAHAVAMLTRLGFDAIDVNDNFASYRRAERLAAHA
ncbi:MAG TPA: MBL fold metallo-hydrolase [Vicinamibacterales bacterium]|nr:MBL fold metallo-hydrolase [Vicinamibacterales bacterium]